MSRELFGSLSPHNSLRQNLDRAPDAVRGFYAAEFGHAILEKSVIDGIDGAKAEFAAKLNAAELKLSIQNTVNTDLVRDDIRKLKAAFRKKLDKLYADVSKDVEKQGTRIINALTKKLAEQATALHEDIKESQRISWLILDEVRDMNSPRARGATPKPRSAGSRRRRSAASRTITATL